MTLSIPEPSNRSEMAATGTETIRIKEEAIDYETDLQTESLSDVMQETEGSLIHWNGQFIKEEWIEDVKMECNEEEQTWDGTDTAAINSHILLQDAEVKEECTDIEEEKGDVGFTLKDETLSSILKGEPTEDTAEAEHDVIPYDPKQLYEGNGEEVNNYQCDQREYETTSKKNVEQNSCKDKPAIRDKDVNRYECDICDYKGHTASLLKDHIERVHDKKKPHTCTLCGFGFFHKGHLKRHLITHTGEKPYACDECGIKFKQKDSLKKHVCPNVSGIKSSGSLKRNLHGCDICDFTTLHTSYLRSHMRIHTKKMYTCYDCGYTCSKIETLKVHVKSHNRKLPYSCEKCKYKCRTVWELNRHNYKHSDQKHLACDVCEFRTNCGSALKTHVKRKHTGEKPFSCEYCDYKCAKMGDLRRHEAKHTGLKRFSCDYCDYKCSRHDVLVGHTRTHNGEKPYFCNMCDFKCTQATNLVQHKRIHSKNQNPRRNLTV